MSEWIQGEGYRKKVLYDEEDLGMDGTKVQVVEIESGNKVEPHYHKKQTEVFSIQNGEAVMGIGEEEYLAQEGDVLICKPGDLHYTKNDSSETFRLIVFKTNYEEEDSYWPED